MFPFSWVYSGWIIVAGLIRRHLSMWITILRSPLGSLNLQVLCLVVAHMEDCATLLGVMVGIPLGIGVRAFPMDPSEQPLHPS